VDDLGGRQNVGLQPRREWLPSDGTLATATTPPGAPRLLRIATDLRHQTAVSSETRGPDVPPPLQAEPLVLVLQRGVTGDATPPPQRRRGATEPLPGCAALDHPKPPARLRLPLAGPVMQGTSPGFAEHWEEGRRRPDLNGAK